MGILQLKRGSGNPNSVLFAGNTSELYYDTSSKALWQSDGTAWYPVSASVSVTASDAGFATTSSNTFIGSQIISGSVFITGSTTSSLGFYGTSSHAVTALTASLLLGSVVSSSYSVTASFLQGSIESSSFSTTASNAILFDGKRSSIFAVTGSNTFVGNQRINGNVESSGTLDFRYSDGTTKRIKMPLAGTNGGLIYTAKDRTTSAIYIIDELNPASGLGTTTTPHSLLRVIRIGPSPYNAADNLSAIEGLYFTSASLSTQPAIVRGVAGFVEIGNPDYPGFSGSYTPAAAYGIVGVITHRATGTLPLAVGVEGRVQFWVGQSGTNITEVRTLYGAALAPSGLATAEKVYGIKLDDQTAGTVENAAIRLGSVGVLNWNNDVFINRISTSSIGLSGSMSVTGSLIVSGGRLGIGTMDPQEPLHVHINGNNPLQVRFSGGVNQYTSLQFYTSSSIGGFLNYISPTYSEIARQDTIEIGSNSTSSAVTIRVGPVGERMRITNNGNVAIGKITPNARLDVSGSTIITGSFTVSGTILTDTITALNQMSAGEAIFQTLTVDSDAMITGNANVGNIDTYFIRSRANAVVTGSLIVSGSITSSAGFLGTSSWSTNTLTASFLQGTVNSASFASTASFLLGSGSIESSSYALTASFAQNSASSSFATTASFALNGGTGTVDTSSFITNAQTSSMSVLTSSFASTASLLLGNVVSASFATTASFLQGFITSASHAATASLLLGNVVSASFATTASFLQGSIESASFASTASYVLNAISSSFTETSSFALRGNFVLPSQTSSFVTNAQTSSFLPNAETGSFVKNSFTSSMTVLSSSFATTASFALNGGTGTIDTSSLLPNAETGSFVKNSFTSSMSVLTASYASTASFVFTSQTASFIQQAISASFSITSSYARTASFVTNAISSSFATFASSGPFVLPSQTSSFITNAQTSSFLPNAETSSFVKNSFTSSMNVLSSSYASTASFVVIAQTASFVQLSVSSSFSTTSSYARTASFVVTANTASFVVAAQTASFVTLAVSSSWAVTSSRALTGPFVLPAQTSSFITNSQTSSFLPNAQTGSFVKNSMTSSMSVLSSSYAATASLLLGSVTSASYAATASVLLGSIQSASFASTASFVKLTPNATSSYVLTSDFNGNASWKPSNTITISQSSHGFVAGNILYLTTSSVYTKALSNDSDTLGLFMVTSVIDSTYFTISPSGYVTGLTGFSPGNYYYVSDAVAGTLSISQSLFYSNPVFFAVNTSSGFVLPFSPSSINTTEFVPNAQTSSMSVLSSSFATTASFTLTTPPMAITRGSTIFNSTGVSTGNFVVWRAPHDCTVTNVWGWRTGGSGATINARSGSANFLATARQLNTTDVWINGGAVQNTAFTISGALEIMIVSVTGSPTQIGVQVDFTKP